jgi:hypothetical protein
MENGTWLKYTDTVFGLCSIYLNHSYKAIDHYVLLILPRLRALNFIRIDRDAAKYCISFHYDIGREIELPLCNTIISNNADESRIRAMITRLRRMNGYLKHKRIGSSTRCILHTDDGSASFIIHEKNVPRMVLFVYL